MKHRRGNRGSFPSKGGAKGGSHRRRPLTKPRAPSSIQDKPPPSRIQDRPNPAKAAEKLARTAAHAKRVDRLERQAWRLANRFGFICSVEPQLVFDPTRGQARVETVRHLVAHVLREIDRARPTDLAAAMKRDRQTLRNSFNRAWDLREEPAVETLILFVAETRGAKFGKFKRAARRAQEAFDENLACTGRGGRHTPQDFQNALTAAARALVHGDTLKIPPTPDETLKRLASEARATQAKPAIAPALALPAAAAILEASPLTRKLLRNPEIESAPTTGGGQRLNITGYALKGDMKQVSAQLARVLEAAGFNVFPDGVFDVPGKSSHRAALRVRAV